MKNIKLTIKGVEVSFSLGLYFVGEIQYVYDMDIAKVVESLDKNPLKFLPEFMYYSAKADKELNGEQFEISKPEMIKMIFEDGGINSDRSVAFLEAFKNSLIQDVPENKEEVVAEKK